MTLDLTTDHSATRCTCSRYNAHLTNLNDWRPDPDCPRHGDNAPHGLDIDTSYAKEDQ